MLCSDELSPPPLFFLSPFIFYFLFSPFFHLRQICFPEQHFLFSSFPLYPRSLLCISHLFLSICLGVFFSSSSYIFSSFFLQPQVQLIIFTHSQFPLLSFLSMYICDLYIFSTHLYLLIFFILSYIHSLLSSVLSVYLHLGYLIHAPKLIILPFPACIQWPLLSFKLNSFIVYFSPTHMH